MRVLVVNAGSSTVKLSLVEPDGTTLKAVELQAPHAVMDADELHRELDQGLGDADVTGHRIVHGGRRFRGPVRVDAEVEQELEQLVGLAPLHQPKSLAAMRAVSEALPGVPAVACFDTAFHATLPPAAYTYALPAAWRERWDARRYGFHGLSHAWIARRAAELVGGADAARRMVSCHLGAGASLCAIAAGRSVDTTMGFTPLEGLVMATRSGSVDPGLLTWLLEQGEISEAELADALEHQSGLLGLAGSADMRQVLDRRAAGDDDAGLALDVYLHRLRGGIAAMAAAMGGLDVLVFTGGVGERSAPVRAEAVAGLDFLGARLDQQRNASVRGDGDVSAHEARVRTLVIRAREDLEIARQASEVMEADARAGDLAGG